MDSSGELLTNSLALPCVSEMRDSIILYCNALPTLIPFHHQHRTTGFDHPENLLCNGHKICQGYDNLRILLIYSRFHFQNEEMHPVE